MANNARKESADEVTRLFHNTVSQIYDEVPPEASDMTVDIELKFKGLIVTKEGSKILFWKDREVKESNIEMKIATRIHIPHKSQE